MTPVAAGSFWMPTPQPTNANKRRFELSSSMAFHRMTSPRIMAKRTGACANWFTGSEPRCDLVHLPPFSRAQGRQTIVQRLGPLT
jgi:hypothetical protein